MSETYLTHRHEFARRQAVERDRPPRQPQHRAVVWSGQEPAGLYWEKLEAFGLTMAPLEPAV